MNREIVLTVICAVYNAEKYIFNCLKSLEMQTYSNFKVILIEDCSTDRTYENIEQYMQKTNLNICLVKNSKNMGVSACWEKGVNLANTDWYFIIDADDMIHQDLIKLGIEQIEKYNDYRIVICENKAFFRDGEEKRVIECNEEYDKYDISIYSDTEQKFMQGYSVGKTFISKKLIEQIDYKEYRNKWPRHFFDDGLFGILICKESSLMIKYNSNLYYYRIHPNSAGTTIDDYESIRDWTESDEKMIEIFEEEGYINLLNEFVPGALNQVIKMYYSMIHNHVKNEKDIEYINYIFKKYYNMISSNNNITILDKLNWKLFLVNKKMWINCIGRIWFGRLQNTVRIVMDNFIKKDTKI